MTILRTEILVRAHSTHLCVTSNSSKVETHTTSSPSCLISTSKCRPAFKIGGRYLSIFETTSVNSRWRVITSITRLQMRFCPTHLPFDSCHHLPHLVKLSATIFSSLALTASSMVHVVAACLDHSAPASICITSKLMDGQ